MHSFDMNSPENCNQYLAESRLSNGSILTSGAWLLINLCQWYDVDSIYAQASCCDLKWNMIVGLISWEEALFV